MQKFVSLLLLWVVPVLFANAQFEKQLDSALLKNFKPKEPGIALLVARKGQVIYQKAYGSANLELDVPLQPDMVFHIGSITKQFTAIGILQLIEQGKISLQDSLHQFIPDFPRKDHTITIEHLLTHTSGLKEYMVIDHPDPYIKRHDLSLQIIIDHFKNAPLDFEPGTRYAYSNSGYAILGRIIEKVTGKPYHEYMKENVLDRAGLKHTSFANEQTIVPKRVAGYTRDAGFYENTYYETTSVGIAVGDLLSTLPDLLEWNKALYQSKLIKKPLLEKAFTPYRLKDGSTTNYGYGWQLDSLYGRRCIYHAGQVSGFISFEFYFPDDDVFLALSSNVKSGEDQTEFSDNRFKLFFQLPFIVFGRKVPGEIVLKKSMLDTYVGKYEMQGRAIAVTKENDRLYLQFGMPYSLHPVSETKFIVPGAPSKCSLEFIKDQSGKVTGMVVYQNGKYEWKKTE